MIQTYHDLMGFPVGVLMSGKLFEGGFAGKRIVPLNQMHRKHGNVVHPFSSIMWILWIALDLDFHLRKPMVFVRIPMLQ